MNKFKAWLIRKLGGYVHMSESPIIYRERPVVTLRGIAPAPDESDITPIDKQREYAERNVLDTVDEYRKYRDIVPLFNEGMWTVTPWYCGTPIASFAYYVRYVNTSGALSFSNAVIAFGLAPACFFDLSILSSRRSARTGRIELYEEGC